MKKTDRAIFALAAAMAVLLTACGSSRAPSGASSGDAVLPSPTAAAETSTPPAGKEAPAVTESPEETEAPAEQSAAPGEAEDPEVDYERIYRPILDKVFHGITTGFDWEQDNEGLTGIIETANSSPDVNEALHNIGYVITDLSGDGIPELALGVIAGEAENVGSLVFAVFTCADGQPKQCLEGWYRSRYEWMGGGRFFYNGSSGAAYSLYGDCSLIEDGTELVWNDFYFSTVTDFDSYEIGYFHNHTGIFEGDGSVEVEEDTFWAGWDALYAEVQALPMTPFSDYGDPASSAAVPVRVVWEAELPGGHADYTSVVSNSSEYAVRLAFVAEETVTDVQFLALQMEDIDASGRPVFSVETLYTQPELTPELPLVAELTFPGDLPAYGIFSTLPAKGFSNNAETAELWHHLMTDVLGYKNYFASCGDMGRGVTCYLAANHPEEIRGIHLTDVGFAADLVTAPDETLTPAGLAYNRRAVKWQREEGAYINIQSTKPQSLAYALADSPAGMAAWLVEKYHAWSDWEKLTMGDLCDCLTLYWMTNTACTSIRAYHGNSFTLPTMGKITVPTAIAAFPCDVLPAPREWIERNYPVVQYTEMPRGGHFTALELPEAFAEDIVQFIEGIME